MILDQGASGERLLSYCTNVHPGESVGAIIQQLKLHTVPLKARFPEEERFAVGLRLGETAVRELENQRESFEQLAAFLAEEGLFAYTINVFPQGSFHAAKVKEAAYVPDWSTPERARYTLGAARILSRLLPPGTDFGTLSTVPLGHGPSSAEHQQLCAQNLLLLMRELAELEESAGRRIQLLLEPEPCCMLETSTQGVAFFKNELLTRAASVETRNNRKGEEQILRYLGICYDICHQAVEFEEASYNLERFQREGIQVGKIQLSCALEIKRPEENPEGLKLLKSFDEPRFLHQVVARKRQGGLRRFADLGPFLSLLEEEPGQEFDVARCHFHLPIHLGDAFPLGTTQGALLEILKRQKETQEVRHLEVETYTLGLLPKAPSGPEELVNDLERELRFARGRLDPAPQAPKAAP